MRVLLLALLVLSTTVADAAPRFFVKEWKPGRKIVKVTAQTQPGIEQPADAVQVAPEESVCRCGGDAAKCRCKSCECPDCLEAAAEIEKAVREELKNPPISPQMAAKTAALETDGVWWDENFLIEAQKPIYAGPKERRKIHVATPSWCPACPKTKAAMGSGDDEIEIVYHTDDRGWAGAKYYPAYWNPRAREFYYNVKLDANGRATDTPWIDNSLENLKAAVGITDSIVGSIPAGEIKREVVERILPILGWWTGGGLKGAAREIPLGSVRFCLPENFGIDWSTTGGVTTFQPTAAPSIKWRALGLDVINKRINFVKYDGETIEFDVPKLPNPVLRIVGPKTMDALPPESPKPAVPLASNPVDDVLPAAGRPVATVAMPAAPRMTYPGPRTRENIIHHLLTAPGHAGKHTAGELWGYDLVTLERLHDVDHHHQNRQARPVAAPVVVRTYQTYCPTCPNRG